MVSQADKPFRIRAAVPGDEPVIRRLRLEALTDAPEAFASTLEREVARTPADWERWIRTGVTLLLEDSQGAGGLVSGLPDAGGASVVHLMSMWVHPRLRGSGGAAALVEDLINRAQARGAAAVRLTVVQQNRRAVRFYERLGFRPLSGEAVRGRDGQLEAIMERVLPEANRGA